MAKYKVLKSVAHNFGHAFTSLMNYGDDDYVMGHILRFARRTGRDTLTIDLVKREGGPPELMAPPVGAAVDRYAEWFWELVEQHGSDRSFIRNATLTLRYDIAIQIPLAGSPQNSKSPYLCEVCITDTRGKEYTAHFDGWWYPERIRRDRRPWWKFWRRA